MRFGAIYKITFPNNKIYIGKTRLALINNLIIRYKHEMKNNFIKRAVVNALRKFSIEKAQFEYLYTFKDITKAKLNQLEIDTIKKYDCLVYSKKGYNITHGGEGGAGYGEFNSRYLNLSNEIISEINQLWNDGYSLEKICIKLNLPNRDIVKRRIKNYKNRSCKFYKNKIIDKNLLKKLINQNKKRIEIANIFNVSKSFIGTQIKLLNLQKYSKANERHWRWININKKEFILKCKENLTLLELAKYFNCSCTAISKRSKLWNIKLNYIKKRKVI